MIARLRGEVLEVGAGRVVVDAGGVGYEVLMPESLIVAVGAEGERVDLYVRHVVRENEISLYGFLNADQRRLFDLLTEAKGCGPKISLSVLSELGEDATASAIVNQDVKSLTRASGVGPRLAERIIVELKDKIQQEMLYRKVAAATRPSAARTLAADDVVEALLALGYRRQEAEAAAEEARAEAVGVEAQVTAALRRLKR